MSFDDEMKDVERSKSNSVEYIRESGIRIVTLKSYKMGIPDPGKCPYIEIVFETIGDEKGENKLIKSTRLFRVREGDTENSRAFKNKRIKELILNAGGDFSLNGEEIIKSAIGNKVKALFKEVEYVGSIADKNNKPEIRTKIEYSFCVRESQNIKGDHSYFKTELNDADKLAYQGSLAKWNRDYGESNNQATSPNPIEPVEKDNNVDDLPF